MMASFWLLFAVDILKLSFFSAVPLSYTERFFIFQLIVLISQPAISLFCFTLTALINLVSSTQGSCFQLKDSSNKPTVCYFPSTNQETDTISD